MLCRLTCHGDVTLPLFPLLPSWSCLPLPFPLMSSCSISSPSLCPCLSAVQCRSSHSACLQAVFLVSLNYSGYLLLFVSFSPMCPVNCTNLKLDWWKITRMVPLCWNNSLTAAFSHTHILIRWNVTLFFLSVRFWQTPNFLSIRLQTASSTFAFAKVRLSLPNWDWSRSLLCLWCWPLNLKINNLNGPRCTLTSTNVLSHQNGSNQQSALQNKHGDKPEFSSVLLWLFLLLCASFFLFFSVGTEKISLESIIAPVCSDPTQCQNFCNMQKHICDNTSSDNQGAIKVGEATHTQATVKSTLK